jgi:hypothetical protein
MAKGLGFDAHFVLAATSRSICGSEGNHQAE